MAKLKITRKKAVTPIIAVVMLLLITLSLAGMAMVIFNQLGKQSKAQIQQQMTKMNIRGELKDAVAEANSNTFYFTAINLFSRKLPVDNKNTEFRIIINGVPTTCCVKKSSSEGCNSGYECVCYGYENKEKDNGQQLTESDVKGNIVTTGMESNKEYYFACKVKKSSFEFKITDDYQIVWVYKEDGRELDREPIIVGSTMVDNYNITAPNS